MSEKAVAYDSLWRPRLAILGMNNVPVKNGTTSVQPGAPLQVSATSGLLSTVDLVDSEGNHVAGKIRDGHWSSTDQLSYGERYTLTATAKGINGDGAEKVSFTTASASDFAAASVTPGDHETVGVGATVAVKFDSPITDKKAAQRAITVSTSPAVPGAFHWISESEVRWRPATFWQPGTKVHVAVATKGINLGQSVYGQNNVTTDFTIGRARVTTVTDKNKTVVVKENGKVVRQFPTSMGKDSTPTNNGTYIVGDRLPQLMMDSSTYGVPVNSAAGYREVVYWDTQLSYSGIYLHAAPWSLGEQGYTDVSNGCLNVSPENAQWFEQTSLRGDPVTVSDTVGDVLPWNDGLGDWNMPWDQWSKGNA